MATNRDNVLRLGALVSARVAHLVDGCSRNVKLADLCADDQPLVPWFGRFFRGGTNKMVLENTMLLTIVGESYKREVTITPASSIDAANIDGLVGLDDPAEPVAAPQPPQLLLQQHHDSDDEDYDAGGGGGGVLGGAFGRRKRWADMSTSNKNKLAHALSPKLRDVVREHTHANMHDDVDDVLLYVSRKADNADRHLADKSGCWPSSSTTRWSLPNVDWYKDGEDDRGGGGMLSVVVRCTLSLENT